MEGAGYAEEIVVLRERIDAWRRVKRGGEAMPAALWDAAVDLAEGHGVYDVSRGLQVDYGKLKRLLAESEISRMESPMEFVEFPEVFGQTVRPSVVEMRRADGASLRVELNDRVDVMGLAVAFLGGVE